MKYLLGILLITISGCATQDRIVKVPVAISCVKDIPIAPNYVYTPGKYKEVFPIIRDLKVDRELMIGYQTELNAVIEGCK